MVQPAVQTAAITLEDMTIGWPSSRTPAEACMQVDQQFRVAEATLLTQVHSLQVQVWCCTQTQRLYAGALGCMAAMPAH